MITEVFSGIFRIQVPLPRNPLRAVNSYVIRGHDRCLIVDTGMNRPECADVLQAGLQSLGVPLDRTDVFVTHSHSDHIGLVSLLKTATSRVFVDPADAAIILDPDLWSSLARSARSHGFPDAEMAVGKHPGKKYLFTGQPEFTSVREKDTLAVGPYRFRCIATPGHTPGHLCLYEPEAGIFFSGDHILDGITPNISGWAQENDDPLGDFLGSLAKVAAYDIRLILPGHRTPITDHRRRIEELHVHHDARTQEVATILEQDAGTAYQVASRMAWDLSYSRWEDFPVPQQWFATGEALAHLVYLEKRGKVRRTWSKGIASFSL